VIQRNQELFGRTLTGRCSIFTFLESTTILTHRYRITAKGLRTAIFYTRLYNRSLQTGFGPHLIRRSQAKITHGKSIRAAKTAVNNWYQNEKIAA
jgi:hypothetical protein